ncbi:hypothetical protein LCGC14_2149150 [marine sediment metagenome]|uniref:Uncharacterized protein n=1 Tax=marine sediment metagenome TaxID=412755 RepID=A0A0F9EIA3_9ZZZZ
MMQIHIIVDGRIIEVINVVDETPGVECEDGTIQYYVKMLHQESSGYVKHKECDGNLVLASKAMYEVMP